MSESRQRVKALRDWSGKSRPVLVKGWVRTRRNAKECTFIELNDGSCLANLQIVVPIDSPCHDLAAAVATGAAIAVTGDLVPSPGGGQAWEVQARRIDVIGACPTEFPLQKKRHTDEFLRTIAHLRVRTNKYGALFRIRSYLAQRIHRFFAERGFYYVHTPIITGSDCEGAGEMFRVTTLAPDRPGSAAEDFFGTEAHLTVSGQLSAETLALGLGDVYTFGPTFRSENSNTSRHAAEFWMLEPEMAFADLNDNIILAEALVRDLIGGVIDDCAEDLALFARFVDKGLMPRLETILGGPFARVTYSEAVEILAASKTDFEFEPRWGNDLQSEHERFLTEQYFHGPLVVTDYPKQIKAFYMRLNDDNRTVAAMDVLVPGIGEIVGGSQREERIEPLRDRIIALGFDEADYWWYLDTRRFGSAPHAGFGMGFERFLMLISGVSNIRDVIPYARTPKSLEF